MQTRATTRMSSKGQVAIPQAVRTQLGLESGALFAVMGDGDVVILKAIPRPSMKEFDSLINEARGQARALGMKRSDVAAAIGGVRGR